MLSWRYIEPYLPPRGTVLDVGGERGKWAIPIAECGLEGVLYDLSKGTREVSRRKIRERGLEEPISLVQGDIHKTAFPDGRFDFVPAEGVIDTLH